MKNFKFILAVGILGLLFPITILAQQQGQWGAFLPGLDGLSIGSTVDNSYSALVINGPNAPSFGECKREIVFKFRTAGTSHIRSFRSGSWGTYLQFLTTGDDDQDPVIRMHIDPLGRVGIGTTMPSHTLSVCGAIRAKEIKVDSDWADFVFKKDYQLPTLQEVENHINEKGHLPDIPSEKNVKDNGINLGEMNALLLQKIEELTLYTIQQQKLIENMQKQINNLKLK